jgi:HEAT repeat protein
MEYKTIMPTLQSTFPSSRFSSWLIPCALDREQFFAEQVEALVERLDIVNPTFTPSPKGVLNGTLPSEMEPVSMADVSVLLRDLNSKDSIKYLAARKQLLAMGKASIPALIDAMINWNDRLCWRAAGVLAEMRDPSLKEVFVTALDSRNPIVRQVAAQAIGAFHDPALSPHLLTHLHDEFSLAQMWIIESLGELRERNAVEPLLSLLTETDSDTIQQSIIRALGRIGDPSAAPPLQQFFNAESRHVRLRAREVYEQLLGADQEANDDSGK